MNLFSIRNGIESEKAIQLNSIDDALRNRIWFLYHGIEIDPPGISLMLDFESMGHTMTQNILDKLGLDSVSSLVDKKQKLTPETILKDLIKNAEWYKIYDFIEIYISLLDKKLKPNIIKKYNTLLEEEKSGYRVVKGLACPITNKMEKETIEDAISTKYDSVNNHLAKALVLYADRKNPDYENSIKESISAVEAMCCIITNSTGKNATLGNTLKRLKDSGIHLHSAMESAFSSLYGYTSDANGIRHGGIDFTNAPAEDAKFMLISCSAFVNYLIEKWSKICK